MFRYRRRYYLVLYIGLSSFEIILVLLQPWNQTKSQNFIRDLRAWSISSSTFGDYPGMYCGFSVVIKEYKETRELVFPFCKNKQDKRCMFCNNWGIILASHFCLVFYWRKSQSVLCSSTMGTKAKASPCAKQRKTMFLSRRIGTAFFMTWLSR